MKSFFQANEKHTQYIGMEMCLLARQQAMKK